VFFFLHFLVSRARAELCSGKSHPLAWDSNPFVTSDISPSRGIPHNHVKARLMVLLFVFTKSKDLTACFSFIPKIFCKAKSFREPYKKASTKRLMLSFYFSIDLNIKKLYNIFIKIY
jgi:hypothetical protein